MKTPKPFLMLAGEAMLSRSISVFQRNPRVGLIQPVLPRPHLDFFKNRLYKKHRWSKCRPAVAGGRDRQTSVYKGLQALPPDVELILIHDGVRPFVSIALTNRVLDAAARYGAALAAVQIHDTVKNASLPYFLEGTVDRRNLWLAQTPQAFHASLLREAHSQARSLNYRATDDSALVETLGHPVRIVPGSQLNLKVTTHEDLVLARALVGRTK